MQDVGLDHEFPAEVVEEGAARPLPIRGRRRPQRVVLVGPDVLGPAQLVQRYVLDLQ
jgi:hypothetical protein